ncbi:MAG: tetratricopeptide repeat protein [Anaerolineae bacterium]|nr:tetratricopeptide repeat protein [Anaerolineae bacterium]MBN8617750.1 tetratricopeptide repeat protein [Anaerolineae bacterium]
MLKRVQLFLGPTMSRVFVAWFALTGLLSLILNVFVNQYDWVASVQTLIVLVFFLGVIIIVVSRLSSEERLRWLAILLPAFGALFLALVFLPQFGGVLIGAALGWVVAMALITRARMPVEYRQAIKHLRKNEYADAVKMMDHIIKVDPNHAQHYKFRGEVYRLWGKVRQAQQDYQKMTQLEPDSPVGFNGLAEVHLQAGDYQQAHKAAVRANELAPGDWVTFYNLGMIEDRLKQSDQVVEHLNQALRLKVKDSRHRLLIYFYLARAYGRLGNIEKAEETLAQLRQHTGGLDEWFTILKSDQAETLRQVIGDDIQTASELIDGDLKVNDLRFA